MWKNYPSDGDTGQADAVGKLKKDLSSMLPYPDKIKVAVSTTGLSGVVDLHFGHARRFSIYEVGIKTHSIRFLEERVVHESYCQGPECDLPEGQEALIRYLIDLLKDCEFLLTRRVGSTPEALLRQAGIIPIMCADTIESAIQKFLL